MLYQTFYSHLLSLSETNLHCDSFVFLEIYRIVSQKQIRDPPEGDTIRPQNVEPIDVKPTMSSDSVRKQCCQ